MAVPPTPPWLAWGDLAGREWAHALDVPGGEELSQVESLEEPEDGVYVWVRESVHRLHDGAWLFVRAERRREGPDAVQAIPAADPEALVAAIKRALGMPPVRVETLGRAGIEIGLEPDDEIEGDELEGPLEPSPYLRRKKQS